MKEANFANAISIQNSINTFYSTQVAVALDPRSIKLKRPNNRSMIEFLADVQEMSVDYRPKSRIVINERTGTVDICIQPVVITHGEITIKILAEDVPRQPAGSVRIDNDLVIGLNENELYTKTGTTTVANVTRSLQKLGASPKDIIAILEAMKSVGAISADLEVI